MFTSLRYFGHGLWFSIHTFALLAITLQLIDDFIINLWSILDKIPCGECRNHALKYINANPPEELKHDQDANEILIGMFRWVWIFHNTVNARLGKPIVDWDTARSLYSNETMCNTSCDDTNYTN